MFQQENTLEFPPSLVLSFKSLYWASSTSIKFNPHILYLDSIKNDFHHTLKSMLNGNSKMWCEIELLGFDFGEKVEEEW